MLSKKIFSILSASLILTSIFVSGVFVLTSKELTAKASISDKCLTITHEGTFNNCSSSIKHSIINYDAKGNVVYHYNSNVAKKGERSVDINAHNYYRPLSCGGAIVDSKGNPTGEAIYYPW